MKAVIDKATFQKEWENKKYGGMMYDHAVYYLDKVARYTSRSKNQNNFIAGKEAEFNEIEMEGKKGKYWKITPISAQSNFSNHSRKQKVEQTKYSGFSTSYVKDLIIAGKINIDDWQAESRKIFNFMVELDKIQQS